MNVNNERTWQTGIALSIIVSVLCGSSWAVAQMTPKEAEKLAQTALDEVEKPEDDSSAAIVLGEAGEKIDLLQLMFAGGYLMLPIAAMSLLVVAFGIERILGLRRRKVMPGKLLDGLDLLRAKKTGFDPRQAYELCQEHPSSAATVIKAMLSKVGRPIPELESAITAASQREATKLYKNVRWLGLAAVVSPLLGLLGTVWGMIRAFFATANLPIGANKAEFLAQGIYVALVTTFAGLAVAIPAAVLAHFLEGKIQSTFCDLDEKLLKITPLLEPYEGRVRRGRSSSEKSEPKPTSTPK